MTIYMHGNAYSMQMERFKCMYIAPPSRHACILNETQGRATKVLMQTHSVLYIITSCHVSNAIIHIKVQCGACVKSCSIYIIYLHSAHM